MDAHLGHRLHQVGLVAGSCHIRFDPSSGVVPWAGQGFEGVVVDVHED